MYSTFPAPTGPTTAISGFSYEAKTCAQHDCMLTQCWNLYLVDSEADIREDWSIMIHVPRCCQPIHTDTTVMNGTILCL